MKYSFTPETDKDEVYDAALRRVKVRRELADALGAPTRQMREFASDILQRVAVQDCSLLLEFGDDILDALERPESFTRYNMLLVLDRFVENDPRVVAKATSQLEDCLYDEDSKNVRLEAFEVLCRFGALTAARSKVAWSYIAEALRCYHGDPEFPAMLNATITLLGGKVDESVKEDAVRLFLFDAENGKGMLQKKAAQIVAFAPEMVDTIKAEEAVVADSKTTDNDDDFDEDDS